MAFSFSGTASRSLHLALVAWLAAVPAEGAFPPGFACLDPSGKMAAVVDSTAIPDVALAYLGPGGTPTIYVNSSRFLRQFGNSLPALALTLYHECGHIQDGEWRLRNGIPNSLDTEEAADIWAVHELYTRGFSAAEFAEAFAAFEQLPAGDSIHLPGPARVLVMQAWLEHFSRRPFAALFPPPPGLARSETTAP